jgi:hypothetical protein
MTAPFSHALLDPAMDPRADPAAAAQLGANTLGIEVTVPCLAALCGLGNIDPQHRADAGGEAAIEAALNWPLPPPGARLVTVRPDADAYGAMAVLGLRADEVALLAEQRGRIGFIAREDRFDHGAWPGPRPMPRAAADIAGPDALSEGDFAIIAGLTDRCLDPDHAVAIAREWITSGAVPAIWQARVEAAAAALLAALENGQVRVTAQEGNRMALVEGAASGALRVGYRVAPVVVAHDPGSVATPRRMVVAQWRAGHADLRRALRALAAEEPGWGGSPTIIGSPQGQACRTPLPRVLAVVEACLT